jgi:uncharacterized membrane protein YhhN
MKSKFWLVLYIIDAILNLLFSFSKRDEFNYVTKPLLIIFLSFYCIAAVKKKEKIFFLLLIALMFSFSGDVFLMFEKNALQWFMLGLISFLLAHISYIILFVQIKKQNLPEKKLNIIATILTLTYIASLLLLLLKSLGSFTIPVFVYAIVISCMFITAFHAFDFQRQNFGKLCIEGTALFIISDSLLAINKFYQPLASANFLIMLTYTLAQLLIALGVTKYLNHTSRIS